MHRQPLPDTPTGASWVIPIEGSAVGSSHTDRRATCSDGSYAASREPGQLVGRAKGGVSRGPHRGAVTQVVHGPQRPTSTPSHPPLCEGILSPSVLFAGGSGSRWEIFCEFLLRWWRGVPRDAGVRLPSCDCDRLSVRFCGRTSNIRAIMFPWSPQNMPYGL